MTATPRSRSVLTNAVVFVFPLTMLAANALLYASEFQCCQQWVVNVCCSAPGFNGCTADSGGTLCSNGVNVIVADLVTFSQCNCCGNSTQITTCTPNGGPQQLCMTMYRYSAGNCPNTYCDRVDSTISSCSGTGSC